MSSGRVERAILRVRVCRDGKTLEERTDGCGLTSGPTFGRDPRCTFVLADGSLASTQFVVRLGGPDRLAVKEYSRLGSRIDGVEVAGREVSTALSTTIEAGPFVVHVEAEAVPPPPPRPVAPTPIATAPTPASPPPPPPPAELTRMIEALETRFEQVVSAPRASADARNGFGWPLAAALHVRACVTAAAGGASEARAALPDAIRATEIDAVPPQYWTTRAILEERAGSADAARSHERAVAAAAPFLPSPGPSFPRGPGAPKPAHVSRTFLARGVWRARSGDVEGARDDLRSAERAESTELTRRWLSHLG